MIDILMLRHFVAVAQWRSFTVAAKHLNVSQSVVSRSVKRLEQLVGATLVKRTTRSVAITAAGEAYYADVVTMLDRLAVATENARRISSGGSAKLVIAVAPAVMGHRIASGIEAFRERWPKVSLELVSINSVMQPAALRAAEIDLGVMQFEPTWGEGIDWHVIAREPVCVAVSTAWAIAKKKRIKLQELRDRPWLMPDPEVTPHLYARLLRLCHQAGFEPKVEAMVSDPVVAGMLLSCGVGATFMFGSGGYSRRDGIEILNLSAHPEPLFMDTAIAWAKGSTSVQIQDFIHHVRQLSPGGE